MALTKAEIPRKEFINEKLSLSRINFDLESFGKYLKITDSFINDRLKKDLEDHDKYDSETQELLYDPLDIYIKRNNLQFYYSSIIISVYSYLEQTLLEICQVAEVDRVIKIEDISGKGVLKFKKYIEKVVGINFDNLNDEWNEITKINQLRNHFVHTSNSVLSKKESNNRINTIKEIKHLKITEFEEHYLIEFESSDVILFFIASVKKFIRGILIVD